MAFGWKSGCSSQAQTKVLVSAVTCQCRSGPEPECLYLCSKPHNEPPYFKSTCHNWQPPALTGLFFSLVQVRKRSVTTYMWECQCNTLYFKLCNHLSNGRSARIMPSHYVAVCHQRDTCLECNPCIVMVAMARGGVWF